MAENATESMKDYEKELERSFRTINEGDIVSGTVIAVSEEDVTLDLNYYTQGIIKTENLSNDPDFNPKEQLQIGDVIEATVIKVDDGNGNIELSKKEANDVLAWDKLAEMMENETVVTVRIKESVPSGVVTFLEGIRAFIPASQLSLSFVEDTSEYVGKQLDVRVITVDENADKLVLSAKSVLREKEDDSNRRKISAIAPGAIFNGTVETLQPYGAFVQLENGLTGLVHISKICMKRIKKPSEVLKVGQEVKVKVLKVEDGKLSLSIKDVEMNTSDIIDKNDSVDDVPPTEYKSEEIPNNPFAALLSGIKLD